MASTAHGCPALGEALTPCCGRVPFELPRFDRLTVRADLVTCSRPKHRKDVPVDSCSVFADSRSFPAPCETCAESNWPGRHRTDGPS